MDNVEIIERMRDKLYDELETYVGGELKSTSCLDAVDKLLHSIKSASTILAMEGYDRSSSGTTYVGTGGSYGYQQGGRRGYDRGRSRGSDDEYMRHLQALKDMAPDDRTAQSIQRMIDERR